MKPFTVTYRKMRVRVVVLKNTKTVSKEYNETGGKQAKAPKVGAFFAYAPKKSKHIGTIYLPKRGGNLLSYVPHEVTHAVMHRLAAVWSNKDEQLAYAVGELSAKIFKKLWAKGIRQW